MPEYTRGAPFETNALRHFQDHLCLPPTILSASLAYEFSHNHPDTGPSPEGRSIGRNRHQPKTQAQDSVGARVDEGWMGGPLGSPASCSPRLTAWRNMILPPAAGDHEGPPIRS